MEFTESSEADSPGDGKYRALVLLCSQLPPVMDLPDPSGLWCLSVSPQHPLLYQSGEATCQLCLDDLTFQSLLNQMIKRNVLFLIV